MSRHSHIPFVEKSKIKSNWAKKQRHLITGTAVLVIWRRVVSSVGVPLLEYTRVICCNSCLAVNVGVDESLSVEAVLVAVGNVLKDSYVVSDCCLAVAIGVAFDRVEQIYAAAILNLFCCCFRAFIKGVYL